MNREHAYDEVWTASGDVVSSTLGNDIALLDFATDSYFTLNGSAAFIWQQLERPTRLRDIGEAVAARYKIASQRAQDDVLDLVERLNDRGLVTRTDNDG